MNTSGWFNYYHNSNVESATSHIDDAKEMLDRLKEIISGESVVSNLYGLSEETISKAMEELESEKKKIIKSVTNLLETL